MEHDEQKMAIQSAAFDRRALLLAQRLRLLGHIRKQMPQSLAPVVSVDDVLQDTYFDAFRGFATFAGTTADSAFRWLVTIANNRMADLIESNRALKRGRGWKQVAQNESMVRMLEELAVYHKTPSRSAVGHEFILALESAVSQLPEDLKTAITLRYIHGEAPAEIARQMKRTERAVHMLCNRALKAVRRLLRTASLFV
jgi:RNA polymerase sigma-70 factor (ECF subfamily)